jgi:alpha-galactosidase
VRARTLFFFAVILSSPASKLFAQDSALAPTPPMGWNSWNKFACNVSEDLIRQIGDAMVK